MQDQILLGQDQLTGAVGRAVRPDVAGDRLPGDAPGGQLPQIQGGGGAGQPGQVGLQQHPVPALHGDGLEHPQTELQAVV